MDEALRQEIAKAVTDAVAANQPGVFTPTVMMLLISTVGAVMLSLIANFFKMRSVQTQVSKKIDEKAKQVSEKIDINTDVSAVAANTGIENKAILIKQGEALAAKSETDKK